MSKKPIAVQEEPLYRVAERFGVSGVALAKTCRRHNIPVPERDYWAKRAAGRAPARPPLPNDPGPETPVLIRGKAGAQGAADQKTADPEVGEVLAAYGAQQPIEVPTTLENATSVVRRTVKALRRQRPDERGLVHTRAPGLLQFTVTKDSLERAARIAEALVVTGQQLGLITKSRAGDADHSSTTAPTRRRIASSLGKIVERRPSIELRRHPDLRTSPGPRPRYSAGPAPFGGGGAWRGYLGRTA